MVSGGGHHVRSNFLTGRLEAGIAAAAADVVDPPELEMRPRPMEGKTGVPPCTLR